MTYITIGIEAYPMTPQSIGYIIIGLCLSLFAYLIIRIIISLFKSKDSDARTWWW